MNECLAAGRELGFRGDAVSAVSMIFVADLLDSPEKMEPEATAVVPGR